MFPVDAKSQFAYGRWRVALSDDFWNYDEKMMSIIDNIRGHAFLTIFRNSLKIEFFAPNGSLSPSLSTMKCQKNDAIFISQYRCVETNLYLIRFNIEIYQKRAFY